MGLISFTIAEGIEVKNSLNALAMVLGSVTEQLFIDKEETVVDFSSFLFMASLIRFQVCLALD